MTSGGYGQMCENVLVSCRVSCKAVASQKEKARRNSLLRRALRCRGDWIRTSDLLNPILWAEVAPSRRMSQMQAFWWFTNSTLHTLYADHSRKPTICPHFPGFSLPNPARMPAPDRTPVPCWCSPSQE
jgi:hypothetical protein